MEQPKLCPQCSKRFPLYCNYCDVDGTQLTVGDLHDISSWHDPIVPAYGERCPKCEAQQ